MTGIERLDEMLRGQLDAGLIDVVNHLKEFKDIDPNIFLNDEKTLKGMCNYISSKARAAATGNFVMIENETVYQWSRDYFEKSNEELGIKKEVTISTPKISNVVTKKQEKPSQEQLTLF